MDMKFVLSLLMVVAANRAVMCKHVYDRNYEGKHQWKPFTFVATHTSTHPQQLDLRVAHNGILTLDTMVPSMREGGLFLRQITNGQDLLQLVYNGYDRLVDCDIEKNTDDVENFLRKFFHLDDSADWRSVDLDLAIRLFHTGPNATLVTLDTLSEEYSHHVDIRGLRDECRKLHYEIEAVFKRDPSENHVQEDEEDVIVDPEVTLNAYKNAADYGSHGFKSESGHSRSKRAMFIYPGTKWCGSGNTAKDNDDLGEDIEIDKCCRDHDRCPYTIVGFQNKWNYFNYRFHTLSHCDCDEKFLSCLKTKSTESADMLGNLFFNIMSTNCFVFKQENRCVRRSWWGKCQKTKWEFTAELREAQPWM